METAKRYFTVPIAVYLVLERDGETLLLRRFNTGYEDGNYSLVAGHLDGDEEVFDAVIREAREEAGIALDRTSLTMLGVMHRKSDHDERVDFFVRCLRWTGEIRNLEPHKCDDLSWFPLNDLPVNVIPYVRHALDRRDEPLWFESYGW